MLAVDLHVLIQPTTPGEYVLECLDSLEIAISRSPYPVNVFLIPGAVGHLGNLRQLAYSKGTAPYVTHVDDDDYVLPDAFAVMEPALRLRPHAVFPNEWRLIDGELVPGIERHHLALIRRDCIVDHAPYELYCDVAQLRVLKNLGKNVRERVYVWRQARTAFRCNTPELFAERQRALYGPYTMLNKPATL